MQDLLYIVVTVVCFALGAWLTKGCHRLEVSERAESAGSAESEGG